MQVLFFLLPSSLLILCKTLSKSRQVQNAATWLYSHRTSIPLSWLFTFALTLFFPWLGFFGCGQGSYRAQDPDGLCALEGENHVTRGYEDRGMHAAFQLPFARRAARPRGTVSTVQDRNTRLLFWFEQINSTWIISKSKQTALQVQTA